MMRSSGRNRNRRRWLCCVVVGVVVLCCVVVGVGLGGVLSSVFFFRSIGSLFFGTKTNSQPPTHQPPTHTTHSNKFTTRKQIPNNSLKQVYLVFKQIPNHSLKQVYFELRGVRAHHAHALGWLNLMKFRECFIKICSKNDDIYEK